MTEQPDSYEGVSVTVEGTLMPAAGVLKRGERATYAYTPRIERLINHGHLKVVEWFQADDDTVVITDDSETEVNEQGGEPLTEQVQVDPPSRSASREDWAEFLAAYEGISIVTEGKTRAQLLEEWDKHLAQFPGGA